MKRGPRKTSEGTQILSGTTGQEEKKAMHVSLALVFVERETLGVTFRASSGTPIHTRSMLSLSSFCAKSVHVTAQPRKFEALGAPISGDIRKTFAQRNVRELVLEL